jgi:drug/metabolite transporter (DMT)-like permease
MPWQWLRSRLQTASVRGVTASLLAALVLGLSPIFAKQAYQAGVPWLSVVTLRTVIATAALWLLVLLFARRYAYIYPVGLAICALAGIVNGLGSLFYYSGLNQLDASLSQLLYALYPIFLTLYYRLDGRPISAFTLVRLCLALAAVGLIAQVSLHTTLNWIGALLMLGSSALYALHLFINSHVLYEMPAPTVTLYTLTAMSVTVSLAYVVGGLHGLPALPATAFGWQAVLLLTAATMLSRLLIFSGVKRLGSLQAALLSLGETLVAVLAALIWLGEKLTPIQTLGAALLAASILLVSREKSLGTPPPPKPWLQALEAWFIQLNPPPELQGKTPLK